MRAAGAHGRRDLYQLSCFDIVDEAIDRDVVGDEAVISNPVDVVKNTLLVILESQPIDEFAIR